MINRYRTRHVLMPLTFLIAPTSLPACTCAYMPTGTCDTSWANGDPIFVGTVASIVDKGELQVEFSSVEILHGAVEQGNSVTVHTGRGEGDCGYPFVTGTQYLVYASGFHWLSTGICALTAPAAIVSATISELRKLRDQGRSDDLFGNIGTAPIGTRWQDVPTIRPLANIGVHAIATNGRRFSTMTAEDGGFRFASLPAGEYAVQEDVPGGFHRSEALQ